MEENEEIEDFCHGPNADPTLCTRELVLVVLEQLYICYDKLGYRNDAEPLLDRLTAIACGEGKAKTH